MWKDVFVSFSTAGLGLAALIALGVASGKMVVRDAAKPSPALPKPAKVAEMKVAETAAAQPVLQPLSSAAPATNGLRVMSPEELIVTVPGSAPTTNRGSVRMAWDAANDPSVIGYAIYCRITNSAVVNRADAGTALSARITGLAEGATYLFWAVSYNASGTESVPSNPVYYTVPTQIYLRQTGWVVESYGVAGRTNQMLVSSNLVNWQVLTQWVGQPEQTKSVLTGNRNQSFFKVRQAP